MIALFAALALAAAADPTPDAAPTAAVQPAAAATPVARGESMPPVNKDGLVCIKEPVVGTRLSKRICYQPADYMRYRQEMREIVEHSQAQHPLNGN